MTWICWWRPQWRKHSYILTSSLPSCVNTLTLQTWWCWHSWNPMHKRVVTNRCNAPTNMATCRPCTTHSEGTLRPGPLPSSPTLYCALGSIQSAVQCSAVQCSAVQCSAVQCSAVQCSAVQCNPVQQVVVVLGAPWDLLHPHFVICSWSLTTGLQYVINPHDRQHHSPMF